jgi:23S rRNA pseudouridine1911/1915/1917 synthase
MKNLEISFVNKLQEREVYKQYEALVVGQVIGSFSIDDPLERDPKNRVKMRVTDFGRDALSHVSLIKFYEGYSHISIEIETWKNSPNQSSFKQSKATNYW